jgi:hypothetical protein
LPHSARWHHALGSATATASTAQYPDPPRSLVASGHWSVPAAPLHAETPASVCSRFPQNTSWFLSWCSPFFPGKSNSIEGFDDLRRPHSKPGYLSPVEFEARTMLA